MFCRTEDPRKFTKKDVKDFINSLSDKNRAGNTLNLYLNSILFVLDNVLNKQWKLNIKYSKKSKKLPVILTFEEIKSLIDSIKNKKHKLMIMLLYCAGLRVNELVHLKIRDFEFKDNYGWVHNGKGGKDRLFIIAKNIKSLIIDYIKENNLEENNYLFIGSKKTHISTRTVAVILDKAKKKTNIIKRVHPHALRHSFATHLIDLGNDICTLQSLLGHSSTNTTMICVHTSTRNIINAKSPLEKIKI